MNQIYHQDSERLTERRRGMKNKDKKSKYLEALKRFRYLMGYKWVKKMGKMIKDNNEQ